LPCSFNQGTIFFKNALPTDFYQGDSAVILMKRSFVTFILESALMDLILSKQSRSWLAHNAFQVSKNNDISTIVS
jgi:hypothetical protein